VTDIPSNDNRPHAIALGEFIILTFSAICTLFTVGWMLWYCRYGIDLTDEGFYLVWMSNPFNYSVSHTQFGFIYHPLYELLNGNIVALRQANILITFCLAWVLTNVFLKAVFGNQFLENTPRLIISGAISTASLIFLYLWLPTPNYNWLTLQSLLIATTGLLLADKKSTYGSVIGWLLIGVGGWLAFMAKPTTAAALGLWSGFYLLGARKLSVRFLLISLVTFVCLLILSGLTIDGSIITFIDRLKMGMETFKLLGLDTSLSHLVRLDDFQFERRAKLILIAGTAVIFSGAYFSQSKVKVLAHISTILSVTFAFASLAIIFRLTHKTLDVGHFRGLLIWSVLFAAMLVGFMLYRFKGILQISRARWALALTFLTLPYVYVFGTGNNYWSQSCHAGIFWVLASLVFLSPIAADRKFTALLLSLGLAVQLVTVALVQTGIETPYRQPHSLHECDYKIVIGKQGSTLLLSRGFGHYFAEAIDLTKQARFKKGTPMIDLSGQSPCILYAIGASNTGQAWTVGDYPGSDKLAVEMLKRVSCEELSRAWLLAEPEGPRKISPMILSSFGANLATDFEIVGTLKTAEGAGGYNEIRLQQILKPVRSVDAAMTACVACRTIRKCIK
jgi:hypothetical protein